MQSFFTSSFFAGNRHRLRESLGGGLIAVTAAGLLQRSSIDAAYRFHQDADFWYLTGIDEPDIILVMDGGKEYLIVPDRPAIREAFDGTVDHGPLSRRSGVKEILDAKAGWERLGKRLRKTGSVYAPAGHKYTERHGVYPNPARGVMAARIRAAGDRPKFNDISQELARLRMIKQVPELKAMQAAMDITVASIRDALNPDRRGKYGNEYELEAEIAAGFRRRGAAGHSFEPIVAGGKRACTLHNVANDSALKRGELVVVDVGAEVEHYAADITRTVALGRPTKRQRDVHAAVLDVQNFALGLLKPGTKLADYEKQVREYMGEKLCGLGLIRSNTPKDVARFYPHGTSHFIGLNVHDAGDYHRPLESGVVVSCEPGIYIAKEGIGVRIEDDVLITKTGNKVLTDKLSRDLPGAL
jgi:Xaa-Pro aminopeptidase